MMTILRTYKDGVLVSEEVVEEVVEDAPPEPTPAEDDTP
jgi:hypothetical protein